MPIENTLVLTEAKLFPIIDRIEAIWRMEQKWAAAPRDLRATGLRIVKVSELMSQAATSRLESVRDAGSGVRYSVWLMGETVSRLAGIEVARSIYTLFEDRNGPLASAWLNSAWAGVGDGIELWSV